jgi:hypothetical protein
MDDEAIEAQERLFVAATAKLERHAQNNPGEHATLLEFVAEKAGDDLEAQAELVDQLLDQEDR